jgi:hypothetical protein
MIKMKNKNNLEILSIADIHWGAINPKLLTDELDEIFIKYIETNKKKLDLIVIDGDYYDTKLNMVSPSCKASIAFMDKLVGICYENDIKLRIVQGTITHDFSQLENFKYFEKQFDFRVISKVDCEEIFPEVYILWMPEEYPENWREYYAEYMNLEDGAKYDMVFFHGTFDFTAFESQKQESEKPLKNSPVFSFKDFSDIVHGPLIGGHIHTRKFYKDKVFYSGSFTRFCFGEPEPKGFLHISYNPKTTDYSVNFIKNKLAPEYNTINLSDICTEEESLESKVTKLKHLASLGGNLKIKIDLEIAEDLGSLAVIKESFSNSENVVIDITEKLEKEKEELEDNTFSFIVNREYPVPDTLKKYIEIVYNMDIPIDTINELIAEDDSDKKKGR